MLRSSFLSHRQRVEVAAGEDQLGAEFRAGWRGAATLLRGPLRALVAGQGLGQLADGLAQVSFAQLVIFDIGAGATPGRIAGVLAATLLPFSVVGPLAGVFIDRWDRRRVLVIASVCRGAIAVAAVGVALVRSEPLAYAGVLLLLSSSRLVLDAKGAVLPRTVAPGDLVRANAVSGVVGMTAAFVGAVGGSAFVSRSVVAGFALAAVGYAAAGVVFLRLPWVGGGRSRTGIAAGVARVLREMRDGVHTIVTTAELGRPLAAVWTHRLLLGAGFVLLVLVADHRYHLSTSGYGLAIAVTGVAAFAGTVIAPWLAGRWAPQALLALAFLPPAAAAAVVGYAPTLAGLLAAVAATAVSFQCLKVLTDALVGRATRDALRGRVFAVYDVLYNVAFVLAGLAMIPLWRPGREGPVLWWLAAAFAASWLAFARSTRCWPFQAAPAPRPVPPRRWRWRAAGLAAGALPVLALPQPTLWWLAWAALVPWLMLLRAAPSGREAAVRGWWVAVGFLISMHYWLLPSTGPFLPLASALLGLLWMPWSAAVWRLLSARQSGPRFAAGLLVIPAGWVLIEAIRSWSALGGPWGLLGASQWHVPALLAPASLGGVWLVSFLIVATNVALTMLVTSPRVRLRMTAAITALAILAAGPLWYRIEPRPSGPAALRVALVQPGVIADRQQRLAAEDALTRAVPPGSADLIIWAESSVGVDLFTNPDLQARLESLVVGQHSDLLVNVDAQTSSGAIEKTAVLIGPTGILGSYQKMRLVPFGEYIPFRAVLGWLADITKAAATNRSRGRHLVNLHAAGVTFAPLICFEIAFPDMSRRAVLDGAELLTYQSAVSTFQGSWAPDQQASLAALRAVETGRPAVQATLTGTSVAFTARGQRLAWLNAHHRGVVQVSVPLANRSTPYLRFGDWTLAWSLIILASAAITASLRRTRIRSGGTEPAAAAQTANQGGTAKEQGPSERSISSSEG
jgi:apolipoprotein N-acyltransferase